MIAGSTVRIQLYFSEGEIHKDLLRIRNDSEKAEDGGNHIRSGNDFIFPRVKNKIM